MKRKFLLFLFVSNFTFASMDFKEVIKIAGVGVAIGSFFGVFFMIPSTLGLKSTQDIRCRGVHTENCNLVSKMYDTTIISMATQPAGLLLFLLSLCSHHSAVTTAGKITLGIGTAITLITALYVDIKLWVNWPKLKQIMDGIEVYRRGFGIVKPSVEVLFGTITNGIWNLFPGTLVIGALGYWLCIPHPDLV